jgi:large subunit ribosomal protein L15
MKYHELQVESNKDRKRVGRGISAGQGKTAGRGTKGQGSRTGKKLKHGFMGGQGALMQRVPKARGFKSKRAPAQVVYLDQLNDVKGATIDNFTLTEAGLVATPHHTVKVIARGAYTGKATVKVQAASASVVVALEKAGGKFEAVDVPLPKSADPKKADIKARKTAKVTAKAEAKKTK